MNRWLVMYEVSQKQRYIFRSNRLRENIGASTIIRWLTEEPEQLFEDWKVPMPKPQYRVIGGGNALYIFATREEAQDFASELSLGVLKHFPGLELFLVTDSMDWNADRLYATDKITCTGRPNVLGELKDRLAAKKNRRQHAVRQFTWGIHRLCPDSGMPANEFDDLPDSSETVARAQELIAKSNYGKKSQQDFVDRFLKDLGITPANGKPLEFMNQAYLEKVLGDDRSAKNYVAIVHLDGNAMGTKVAAFFQTPFRDNDDFLDKYAKFTRDIDVAYNNAMRKTIEHVMKRYNKWADTIYGKEGQKQVDFSHYVPLRPVVASGDDISFIAVGQLGIELARIFLQYLQQEPMYIEGVPFRFDACAGVALVRRKFPFWLAYELAEQLCSQAKKRLKRETEYWRDSDSADQNKEQKFEASLIDWELIPSGDLDLNVEDYREAIYRTKDGIMLLNRPYYLFRDQQGIKSYHPSNYMTAFLRAIETIRQSIQDGTLARSKWKRLRAVYHQGKTATEHWVMQNHFEIGQKPFVALPMFPEKVSAYFYDAIEIIDHMIPLDEVNIQ